MEICTLSRTRATTLPSRALEPTTGWQGRDDRCVRPAGPSSVAFQGGAIGVAGLAFVTDLMVTDHPYSTRPGPPSCSPPV